MSKFKIRIMLIVSSGFSFFFFLIEQFPGLRQPACEHKISCKTRWYCKHVSKYVIAHPDKSCQGLSTLLEMNYVNIPEEVPRPSRPGITATSRCHS